MSTVVLIEILISVIIVENFHSSTKVQDELSGWFQISKTVKVFDIIVMFTIRHPMCTSIQAAI